MKKRMSEGPAEFCDAMYAAGAKMEKSWKFRWAFARMFPVTVKMAPKREAHTGRPKRHKQEEKCSGCRVFGRPVGMAPKATAKASKIVF